MTELLINFIEFNILMILGNINTTFIKILILDNNNNTS